MLTFKDIICFLKKNPIPALVLTVEGCFGIAGLNDAFLKEIRKVESELIGKSIFDVIPDQEMDGGQSLLQSIRTLLHQVVETLREQELSVLKSNINERGNCNAASEYWKYCACPILNDKGEVTCIVLYMENISGRNCNCSETRNLEVEKELVKSNERFKLATRASSDAIWDYDRINNIVYLGEGFLNMFGYGQIISKVNRDWMTNNIHPDDVERVVKTILEALFNPQTELWNDEYRYRKACGEYAIVTNSAVIVRNENGEPYRMIGAMKDITLRKEEEHHLKLLESVVTNTKDAVIITSTEIIEETGAKIVYINKAFLEITGFAPEDVLGKSTKILTGPETNFDEIAKIKTAMRKGESCNIKSLFYKKNGETYWGSLAIAPVTDSSGEIKNYIAINRDITDIINYIKEIEDQNKRLREISWTQSHLVRGPLSRILGLVNLMASDKEQTANEELLPLLQKSAIDLDDVIKEIIRKTQEFNKPLN